MAGRFLDLLGTLLPTLSFGPKDAPVTLNSAALTAPRQFLFPDKGGTIALTSDITGGGDVTSNRITAVGDARVTAGGDLRII